MVHILGLFWKFYFKVHQKFIINEAVYKKRPNGEKEGLDGQDKANEGGGTTF